MGGSNSTYTQTAGTTTVNGTLTGSGAPILDLNGGNLYGTGTVDDAVVDAATITPGSATTTGKLQVNGTYAQNTGGALDVTIGGTTAGTQYDQLNVSSTAGLNGTLNIKLASGYTPAVGNTFDILNASSITGNFSTITGLSINGGEHFTVTTVSGDEIVLTVGIAPVSAAAYNSMAAMNHMRFECGVDVNVLRKTSPRRLLKALCRQYRLHGADDAVRIPWGRRSYGVVCLAERGADHKKAMVCPTGTTANPAAKQTRDPPAPRAAPECNWPPAIPSRAARPRRYTSPDRWL